MKIIHLLFVFFARFKNGLGQFISTKMGSEQKWPRFFIGFILLIVLVNFFPSGKSPQFADLQEGSISTQRIIAPFRFEILKTTEEYERDREIATQKVYPIFNKLNNQLSEVNQNIDLFFNHIEMMRNDLNSNRSLKPVLMDSLLRQYPISFPDTYYWELLVDPQEDLSRNELTEFRGNVKRIVRDIMTVGVLNVDKEQLSNPDRRMVVIENNEEVNYPIDNYYDLQETRDRSAEMFKNNYPENTYFVQIGFGIVNYFLRPNLIYDEALHKQRIDNAVARVPLASGFVDEDEKIVDRNERITPEIRKKLVSLATVMAEKGMAEGGMQQFLPVVGRVVFILILFFLLGVFIHIERPEILRETKAILIIALIILIVSLIAFLIHTFLLPRLDAAEYLVPSALGAMLLATLFDAKIGYVGTVVISVLLGGIWGNEFNLVVISFFVGVVSVTVIKRVQGRRQFVQVILSLIGANIVAITFMGFLRFVPFREIAYQWIWGGMNGLLTPILMYGLLPLIESTFDITTDFSLLEISNLNHPLLKRLSVQAPGTYHHSIIVGNLAEAAAQAINGNSLLARVGSYYHDVGKIEKAEYFVENQMSKENPHKKLMPRMSALILMNHVKRGLEIAEKYKLPSLIKDIINQHQGTTIMTYFYQKALDKDGSEEASEVDYRYPGPRPQTKEAAIVMLADAVEAATRSLKEPTHSRLKGIIEEIVDGRFQEGELDQSPLTLNNLERIKESFLNILAGTFHARVEYPDKDEQAKTKKTIKQKEESSAN
ncbi:HDIG domain-containing protein [bacterium]|nr:HDIG domain-containing protein [bacterium]